MNKRILVLLLSLMMLIGVVLGATGCDLISGSTGDNTCEHQWLEATCTAPKTCTLCQSTEGEALGHTGGEATCISKATCTRCNEKYGELAEHSWNEATCLESKKCTECNLIEGSPAGHKGGTATCSERAKCDTCGEAYGELASHSFSDATCEAPATCGGCGETVGEALPHVGGTASCTEKAICDGCGKPYGDLAPHAWVDADCEQPKHCENCPATEGKALDHIGGTASCTEQAKCERCGEAYGELAPHAWVDADCEQPKHCENCTATEGEALGHTGGTATCSEKAVCDRCSNTYGTTLEHSFTEKNTDSKYLATKATCEESATYYYSCANCGDRGEETFTDGDPLGHTYGAWVSNGDGTHTKRCLNDPEHLVTEDCHGGELSCTDKPVCDDCKEEYGDEPSHAWNGGEVTLEPDCETAGTRVYTCTSCGETKEEVIKATGHSYESAVTEPTCLENGYTTHSCSACGNSYTDSEVDALGHDWNGERTCIEGHTCNRCPASEDALGHSHTLTGSTEADCENAATETYTCSACSDSYTNVTAPATGHNTTGVTATEEPVDGCEWIQVYTCNTCGGRVEGQTVYHHTYVASIVTPATCTAEGEKALTCADCGHVDTAEETKENRIIPVDTVTGHDWVEGKAEGGKRVDTCNNCGETKTVTVVTNDTVTNVGDLKDTEINLESGANITLGGNAADNIGTDVDVSISADTLTDEEIKALNLDADKLAQINGGIYNFSIKNGDTDITQFGEDGYVTVTLPYTLLEGDSVDNIAVWYINDKGELDSFQATYNNGYVTFTTNHFSYYTVTRLTPAERCALYGHMWTYKTVEVTCTTDGYTLQLCTRCAEFHKNDVVTAPGHDIVSDVTEATCTVDGLVVSTCNNCNYHETQKLAATGHSYSLVETVAPTCDAVGSELYVCSACDSEITVTIAQLKHEYSVEKHEPTCDKNGYTSHSCVNCEYSYNDEIVPAHGHEYKADWKWHDDHKHAEVSVHCIHGCDFHAEGEVEATERDYDASCSKAGRHEYTVKFTHNGVTYTDKFSEEGEKLPHNYKESWNHDKGGHWHECRDCGEKSHEIFDHEFDEGHLVKRPGCATKGEIAYLCSCGYVHIEYTDPTEDHYFVDGICQDCGFSKNCDHTELERKVIDFEELGFCGGSLEIYTCECGKVKTFDPDEISIICDIDDSDYGEGTLEDGTPYQWMSGTCPDCGLYVYAYATMYMEGCGQFVEATYYFYDKQGGNLIVDASYVDAYYRHDTEVLPVGLTDKSCGTELYVEKCVNCGTVKELDDMSMKCNFTPTVEEFIDDAGNAHQKQTMTCPDCGLVISMDMYVVYENACEMTYYGILEAYVGGELVFEFTQSESSSQHEYEESYEMKGETCEDGYTVTRTCPKCSDTYSYNSDGHRTEHVEFNLSELGMCDGYGYKYVCKICDAVTSTNINWSNCKWTGEYNEELGINVYTCENCGTVRHYLETRSEKDDKCRYDVTVTEIYYIGETVLDMSRSYSSEDHNYKYDYVLNGESCEDGYITYVTCTDCGYSYNHEGKGHNVRCTYRVDLTAHGMCGEKKYFEVYSCACGQEGWVGHNIHEGCDYRSEYNEYVDDNGVTHYVETMYCATCNSTVTMDRYNAVDGCYVKSYATYNVSVNGTVVIDNLSVVDGTMTMHKYEYSYNLRGESCEDGVDVIRTCTACGESYKGYYTWHYTMREHVSLSEYGACGGYLNTERCPCGYYDNVSFDGCGNGYYTNNEYIDENGVRWFINSYYCEHCGLRYTDRYYSENGEDCTRNDHHTVDVSVGDTLVKSSSYVSTYTDHSYVVSGSLMEGSKTCDDGAIVTHTCEKCGYSYTNEIYWHESFEQERINLSEYGAKCTGYISFHNCCCGADFGWALDHALCEFDEQGCTMWVEDYIDYEYQETAEGGRHFEYSTWMKVCAVTDPEQCGFTIRYAMYWAKNEDCSATRYFRIQLGYDELTDTCLAERIFELEKTTYHNYQYENIGFDGDEVSGYKYVCSDCGSYYTYTSTRSSEGYELENKCVYVNTLDDGNMKYRESLTGYLGYADEQLGYNYANRYYYKYIHADGSEYWSNEDVTIELYHDAPFGVNSRIRKVHRTASDGENTYRETATTSVHGTCCNEGHGREYTLYVYHINNNNGYWTREDYTYDLTCCGVTCVFTSSEGGREVDEYDNHWSHYGYLVSPTCTQYGLYGEHCMLCGCDFGLSELQPTDHNWVQLSNGLYYCFECGLQNINGASGDVVMEDLTEKYGDGENYVVGYWARTYVQFSVNVSLILHTALEDGTDQVVISAAFYEVVYVDDPYVGVYVSKAQIEEAALLLGYTPDMYDARISFVPDGADGSFDYAITFGDLEGSEDIDYVIRRDEFFFMHVYDDSLCYTICPDESGAWSFRVEGNDYSRYTAQFTIVDEENECDIAYGYDALDVELEAGKTYTLYVNWSNYYDDRGYVAVSFNYLGDAE